MSAPHSNRRTALLLGGVVLGMFGFGFALVPLYGLLCNALGIPTAATVATPSQVAVSPVVGSDRTVTLRLDTNVSGELPWDFEALTRRLEVEPGKNYEVRFRVRNRSAIPLVAQALPNVVPWQATDYLIKTECFCFQEQPLQAGEERELVLRLAISPQLPTDYSAVTLSYIFMSHASATAPHRGDGGKST